MIEPLSLAILYLCFLAFGFKRLLTYTHALQQDDYSNARLFKWMTAHRVFDKKASALLFGLLLLSFFTPHLVIRLAAALIFGALAFLEKDPAKRGKKKLVITARVKRLIIPAFLFLLLVSVPLVLHAGPVLWIACVQAIPFLLMLANTANAPIESRIQKKYWQEAHDKINALKPTVVAVTGSFGKTSIKHILGHILKSSAPTLVTPGSVNTSMGTTRIIREQLEENHKYLVVEMGAYGHGSIERLCTLTPPDIGIISAIGHAHYERFKTLEAVAETKFELALAVLAKRGKVIAHENTLCFPYTQDMAQKNAEHFIICGEGKDSALTIRSITQDANGVRADITWNGTEHTLQAPLYGLHHGENMALAFGAAMALGLPEDHVRTALKSTPQITHRLEVKRQGDGTVLIDDAFNSNPAGFKAALDVLKLLKPAGGRAILITPGMVELGERHDTAHMEIGAMAGTICDIAIVVAEERIPSFIEGFRANGSDKTLIEVARFEEATAWLDANRKSGDSILIENDLPDIYERVPNI